MEHSGYTNTNSDLTSDPSASAAANMVEIDPTEPQLKKVSASDSSEEEFFEALESQEEGEDVSKEAPLHKPLSPASERGERGAGGGEGRSPKCHSVASSQELEVSQAGMEVLYM